MATDLPEGLRERKKRLTRQHISDVATGMFLERGFDQVRVAEIASAAGVSEKTVFNYFPTKESLLLDREAAMAAAIRRALGPDGTVGSPVEAMVHVIVEEFDRMSAEWADPPLPVTVIHRFQELVEATPSLRAAQRDMMDRMVQVAAEAMAERAGVDPEDPEPQVTATALLGLWRVFYQSMHRSVAPDVTLAELRAAVLPDVRRAARLVETGLWSFPAVGRRGSGRDDVRSAVRASVEARQQAKEAIRQARSAWREAMREATREATREAVREAQAEARRQRRARG